MTHDAGPAPDLADLLADADQALVRTVDGLADAAYAEPSLLPDWSRAHVVAHLTLNAEGLAGVLHGAHLGQPQPMYASPEARDGDIAELATAGPAELRERFLASTGAVRRGARRDGRRRLGRPLRAHARRGRTSRSPTSPLMRVREVEIHHADLDAGYAAADWPAGFRVGPAGVDDQAPLPRALRGRPTDLDRTWHYGEGGGGPVVTGTSAAIGWWLTGRGNGEGVTSDTGSLPEVESW